MQAYTAEHESPALLQQEFYAVQAARPDLSGPDGLEGFSIRANAASREVVAVLEIEEGSSLELAVKLPPASPLRPAEAECRRRVRFPACCLRNRPVLVELAATPLTAAAHPSCISKADHDCVLQKVAVDVAITSHQQHPTSFQLFLEGCPLCMSFDLSCLLWSWQEVETTSIVKWSLHFLPALLRNSALYLCKIQCVERHLCSTCWPVWLELFFPRHGHGQCSALYVTGKLGKICD